MLGIDVRIAQAAHLQAGASAHCRHQARSRVRSTVSSSEW